MSSHEPYREWLMRPQFPVLLDDYRRFAESLWVNHKQPEMQVPHCVLGLVGETGEVAELFKKVLRGDAPVDVERLTKELGDVIYYWTMLCSLHGLDPDTVIRANVEKLSDRARRGVIRGSGDNR